MNLLGPLHLVGRRPLSAALMVALLTAGTGVLTGVWSALDALVSIRVPHVMAPDNLVVPRAGSFPAYRQLRDDARGLKTAAFTTADLTLDGEWHTPAWRVECVTADYFGVLGTGPVRGRTFLAEEEYRTGHLTTVLSYGRAVERFGSVDAALGQVLRIGGRTFEVVGVTPPRFRGLGHLTVDAWILLTGSPHACAFTGSDLLESAASQWLTTIARLEPGNTPSAAAVEVERVLEPPPGGVVPPSLRTLEEFRGDRAGQSGQLVRYVTLGAALVLLIVALNISALCSVSLLERQQELTLRAQLGATPFRLVRDVTHEHLALAVASLVPAAGLSDVVGRALASELSLAGGRSDWGPAQSVLVVTGVSVAAAFAALMPALRVAGVANPQLTRVHTPLGMASRRWRASVVIAQAALVVPLMVCAQVFVRSATNATSNLGFSTRDVLVLTRPTPDRAGAETLRTWDEAMTRVATVPGVRHVALTEASILGAGGTMHMMPLSGPLQGEAPIVSGVTPEYFQALHMGLLEGRALSANDSASHAPVAVINASLASTLWPERSALGECLEFISVPCVTVVGVMPDRKVGGVRRTSDEVLMPMAQTRTLLTDTLPQALVIAVDPEAPLADLRAIVRDVDPGGTTPFRLASLESLLDAQTRTWRTGARVFGVFSLAALALAVTALYGVLAVAVRQRRGEIAMRMVVGGRPASVVSLVAWQGAKWLMCGVVLGIGLSYAAFHVVASLLLGITSLTPDLFVYPIGALAVGALVAVALPAWTASRVEPAAVLRSA